MVIFHSYVSLPKGTFSKDQDFPSWNTQRPLSNLVSLSHWCVSAPKPLFFRGRQVCNQSTFDKWDFVSVSAARRDIWERCWDNQNNPSIAAFAKKHPLEMMFPAQPFSHWLILRFLMPSTGLAALLIRNDFSFCEAWSTSWPGWCHGGHQKKTIPERQLESEAWKIWLFPPWLGRNTFPTMRPPTDPGLLDRSILRTQKFNDPFLGVK